MRLFSNWIDRQLRIIEKAEASLGKTRMKEITRNMKNPEERISARDNSKNEVVFVWAMKSRKSRLIQVNNFADVTAWMDGSVFLSYLTGTNKAKEFILAELDARGVKLTRKQRKNLKEHELKPFLVDHEIVRLQKEENKFVKVRNKVKTIRPLSDKMVEWLPKQWEIYKKRKGITIEE